MELPISNLLGEKTGEIKLPESIFSVKDNPRLLAQAVRVYLQNQRQGTLSTKTRGEVQGSTRKIYRQKGTGKARHGSKRAPIFVKGGIVFGPRPRDFSLKLPQKMKQQALFLSLSKKFKEQKIIVLEDLYKIEKKTKAAVSSLKNLKLIPDNDKILLIVKTLPDNIRFAFSNIQNLTLRNFSQLNPYEILNNSSLLFTKDALEELINKNQKKEIKKETPAKEIKVTKIPKSLKSPKTLSLSKGKKGTKKSL